MKKVYAILAITALLGCGKSKCVSCVALTESKEIVEHSIICDQSSSYLKGWKDGVVQRYKDQGNNVEVTCKFN